MNMIISSALFLLAGEMPPGEPVPSGEPGRDEHACTMLSTMTPLQVSVNWTG